jgi:hypothetical protein
MRNHIETATQEIKKPKADVQATWRKHGWLPQAERQAQKQYEKVVDRVTRALLEQHAANQVRLNHAQNRNAQSN